ncbi:MAG: TIGR04282 family arsenosugar biosynthesis glycosyltransferase [Solirubrobacteraceae bacterium MAG38_C4-C5]|nr:TIGR04282 family arsenosugar biosynthesis glycosyltransferase [Candidatus Siliceabacter maunaloa]
MSVSAPALAVIAKAPVAGRVKTRLCPPCTPQQAAALAGAALEDTLAAVAATPAHRRVLVLDGEPGDWVPEGFEVIPQRGDGLAERLADAFATIGEPTLLVGMDTPQVTARMLIEATALLRMEGVDAVQGDADDGGYWAIGLQRPDPAAFAGVPMSAEHTGVAQRARLAELGLAVADLPPLRDVDTIDDAVAVAAQAPASHFAAALRAVDDPAARAA